MGIRFSIILLVFLSLYAFLVFHLYELQVSHGKDYLAQAQSEYAASGVLTSNRGGIYFTDKNGNHLPAAIDKDFPVVYAVPTALDNPKKAAALVAPALGMSVADIQKKFLKKDAYELLKKKADDDVATKINDLKLKGVYVMTAPSRYYPFNELASQVLGFVGPNSTDLGESGRYGIESLYNDTLSGQSGTLTGAKITTPHDGADVNLTIDPAIQSEAEQVLRDVVREYSATAGSVIVEEPKTGKILAMGSVPSFDPNSYSSSSIATFLNPVVQKVYEPGSVVKVLTMAAGVDSGKITPDTTYVDTGFLKINGRIINNDDYKTHGPYGKITMTNVLEHSLNVGAAFAERTMGRDIFTHYLKLFGLDQSTKVGLPGEVKGSLQRLNPKEPDVAFATASFGQGISVTPLEILQAVAAIANGGNLMRPYLDASLSPQIVRRVVSEDTAKKVTGMMVSAIDRAKIATIDGYSLAGKTGTASVPDFVHGGYTQDVINTYIGFGPASEARFIILLRIDQPEGAPLAGLSVVPAFRTLAQFMINYYAIPPDRLPTSPPTP